MSTVDPIAAILAELDRPATVRQEFADALLSRLLAELTAPAPRRALIARPARATGSPRRATTWLPRGRWRRVILAFALVVVGVVVVGSALAALGVHPLGGLRAPAGHRAAGGHRAAAGHRHGSLDTSFGRGGKVTGTIGPGGAAASALAIQKDGKLVAAGGGYQLVRYWP